MILSWSKDPIKRALLVQDDKTVKRNAVECFRYVGEVTLFTLLVLTCDYVCFDHACDVIMHVIVCFDHALFSFARTAHSLVWSLSLCDRSLACYSYVTLMGEWFDLTVPSLGQKCVNSWDTSFFTFYTFIPSFSHSSRFIQSYMGDRPLTPVVPGLGNGNASSKPDPNSVKDDKLDLDLIRYEWCVQELCIASHM